MQTAADNSIIYTRSAHCRDCYKCLRNCPVSCISMNEGQAEVLGANCIVCGTCIKNCPQQAKQYFNNIYRVEQLLKEDFKKTAVSIAPSFAANLDLWQQKRLAGALRSLGFNYVYETAIGAYYTAQESLKYIDDTSKNYIHSSCPAVINYIAKYKPELARHIAPVVSPMVGHARLLKQTLGEDVNIVFIGPCVAKKDEAAWKEYEGLISNVLTFEEMFKMLKAHNIDLKKCDETPFDIPSFYKAQYYPLPGGILKTLGIEGKDLDKKVICIDGADEVKNALDNFTAANADIELMWCEGGCLNGPIATECSIIKKRANIADYAASNKTDTEPQERPKEVDLYNRFQGRPLKQKEYSQAVIEQTLKTMGKEKEEDRLNCGGCGYHSCRDKAVAILNGYATKEMCMPYLRQHLHVQNISIIDSMPGGVVVLDSRLNVVQVNANFKKMFKTTDSIVGQDISLVVDPHPFERVLSGEVEDINWITEYPQYNLKCRFIVYNPKDTDQLVGVFIPILNAEELSKIQSSLKMQALDKARELLKHQIDTSQKIAKYLGESTAESQDIVNQIMQITMEDSQEEG